MSAKTRKLAAGLAAVMAAVLVSAGRLAPACAFLHCWQSAVGPVRPEWVHTAIDPEYVARAVLAYEESGTGSLREKKAGPLMFRRFLSAGSCGAGAAREGLIPAPIDSRFSPPKTDCRMAARAGGSVGWPRSRTRAAAD